MIISSRWQHFRFSVTLFPLQWRHNERGNVSNHQPHACLLNRLFRHKWKNASKLCVTGLCEGNSPVTGEFPAQRASNAENVSIWWRLHDNHLLIPLWLCYLVRFDQCCQQLGQYSPLGPISVLVPVGGCPGTTQERSLFRTICPQDCWLYAGQGLWKKAEEWC